MIFNLENINDDHDFVLVFGDTAIDEAGFNFNNPKSKKDKFKDSSKFNIGTIRIRNKYEASNVTGERNHGVSIKVVFDKDKGSTPVVFDRTTGDIIFKNTGNDDDLSKIDKSKVNYIQNFIYANLGDIVNYYETNDVEELEKYKNNILSNSVGKSFKKRVN